MGEVTKQIRVRVVANIMCCIEGPQKQEANTKLLGLLYRVSQCLLGIVTPSALCQDSLCGDPVKWERDRWLLPEWVDRGWILGWPTISGKP